MQETDGFVIVYSITDAETFAQCQGFRDQIMREINPDGNKMIPFVLVGNKCDLTDKRQVTTNEGETLAKDWKCFFVETTAKDKIRNGICFIECVKQIRYAKKVNNTHDDTKIKQSKCKCYIL